MKKLLEKLNVDGYSITKTTIGRSSNDVYKLVSSKETIYLKIGDKLVKDMGDVLEFLMGSIVNVPRLLAKGFFEGKYYVLMSECTGTMVHEINPELAIKKLAEGLKQLHKIDISNLTIVRDIAYYKNQLNNLTKTDLSQDDIEFIGSMDLLTIQNDMVFIHGDYSLPNVLYDNKHISFIDLDYACVGFRYVDILDCLWSIEYNFGNEKFKTMFLKEYGIDKLDINKVKAIKTIQRILKIKGYQ